LPFEQLENVNKNDRPGYAERRKQKDAVFHHGFLSLIFYDPIIDDFIKLLNPQL
jgi:hypothetical protein